MLGTCIELSIAVLSIIDSRMGFFFQRLSLGSGRSSRRKSGSQRERGQDQRDVEAEKLLQFEMKEHFLSSV